MYMYREINFLRGIRRIVIVKVSIGKINLKIINFLKIIIIYWYLLYV